MADRPLLDPRTLVWPSLLAGEARQRQAVPPAPVYVAMPKRLRDAGMTDPNPGPAVLVALLYRTGGEEPTHAEVMLRDGRVQLYPPAWIASAATVIPLHPFATPARRTA